MERLYDIVSSCENDMEMLHSFFPPPFQRTLKLRKSLRATKTDIHFSDGIAVCDDSGGLMA